ncbi:MAG: hypothetical protein WDM76_06140 [Limisphaerales bacterium]
MKSPPMAACANGPDSFKTTKPPVLLDQILNDEKSADNKLTALAETHCNLSANLTDEAEDERPLARAA